MIGVIEVKDSITDTVAAFPDTLSGLDEVETALTSLDDMLTQKLWTGEAKDKCVQIQGLLKKYEKDIRGLVEQMQSDTRTLQNHMHSFPSDSDSLRSINSI